METPQTLSYQLPHPLPEHRRKEQRARHTALIFTAVGIPVFLLAALLVFFLLGSGSDGESLEPTTPIIQTPASIPTQTPNH